MSIEPYRTYKKVGQQMGGGGCIIGGLIRCPQEIRSVAELNRRKAIEADRHALDKGRGCQAKNLGGSF